MTSLNAIPLGRSSVAAVVWLIYDASLCFQDEMAFIWDRWSEQKGRHSRRLYVSIRYISIFGLLAHVTVDNTRNLNEKFCTPWRYVDTVIIATSLLLPDALQLYRIQSVWEGKALILIPLVVLFLAQVLTAVVAGFATASRDWVTDPARLLGCGVPGSSLRHPVAVAAWLCSIVTQSIYIGMIFYKLFSISEIFQSKQQRGGTVRNLVRTRKLIPSAVEFVRCAATYFALSILSSIINIALVLTLNGPAQMAGIPWAIALSAISSTRLSLRLLRFLYSPAKGPFIDLDETGHGVSLDELTPIEFVDLRRDPDRDPRLFSSARRRVSLPDVDDC